MKNHLTKGIVNGFGFILVLATVFGLAYAADIFTVDQSGTNKFVISDQGKITIGATESHVNLVIQNNSGAVNTTVDLDATLLIVEGIRIENLNTSANITVAGAGGLDTGAEAADTWYYLWVITNNDGSSINGLISTSSTAPTMPGGFTKKRRVGAVRNNSSSDFHQFVQEGNKCILLGKVSVVTAGQATSITPISCASAMPPTSRTAMISAITYVIHNTAGVSFHIEIQQNGSTGTVLTVNNVTSVANVGSTTNQNGDVPTDSSQNISYNITNVPSTFGGAYIYVHGYYDRF